MTTSRQLVRSSTILLAANIAAGALKADPTKVLLVLGLVVFAAVLAATAGAKNRPTTGNGAESVGTAAWTSKVVPSA